MREDILAIEKKIKSNYFKKMIDFNQELDAIKQSFVKLGPNVPNKETLLVELTERLVYKAAEYIA